CQNNPVNSDCAGFGFCEVFDKISHDFVPR
ncbi:MAG: hypothetical protein ACI8TF_000486, partial [Paracoccaceae bacterium]